jgi:hypothetical protein
MPDLTPEWPIVEGNLPPDWREDHKFLLKVADHLRVHLYGTGGKSLALNEFPIDHQIRVTRAFVSGTLRPRRAKEGRWPEPKPGFGPWNTDA